MLKLIAGVLFGALLVVACSGQTVKVTHASEARERPDSIPLTRRFVDSTFLTTLWQVAAGAASDEFDTPFLMHASERALVVWDATRLQLTALNSAGSVVWRSGQVGAGPGEFRQVRDLEPMGGGAIALLDNGNRRVTAVDESGAFQHSVMLQGVGSADQFFSLGGGVALFPTSPTETRGVVVVDSNGRVTDSLPLPWAPLAHLDPLVRQLVTIESDRSNYRVIALKLGDGFWAQRVSDGFRGEYIEGWYREHQDFPAVIRQQAKDGRAVVRLAPTPMSAVGGAVEGDALLILFAGATDRAGRIVDVYRVRSAAYRCSFLLPEQSNSIELRGGTLFSITAAEVSGVVAYDVRRVLQSC